MLMFILKRVIYDLNFYLLLCVPVILLVYEHLLDTYQSIMTVLPYTS